MRAAERDGEEDRKGRAVCEEACKLAGELTGRKRAGKEMLEKVS